MHGWLRVVGAGRLWRPWMLLCVGVRPCLLSAPPLIPLPCSPAGCPRRRYVVPLLWLPVAAAFMWRGVATGGLSLGLLPASFVAGVLIWQLMEYSIHRWAAACLCLCMGSYLCVSVCERERVQCCACVCLTVCVCVCILCVRVFTTCSGGCVLCMLGGSLQPELGCLGVG